ncbi:MAG: thiamine-phosphate kinase [Pseudoalteromonas spongiae]|uniref:thiamine-phosphate kinase n=1 Tax=Pseudoalteromonas TaxID=53246 RepID=UPI0006D5F66A|nr:MULTISPECIES: thiamine-phosphate kinase [Pseudoalteromonas]KPV95435.1 Thiamine-monophosphate kinase [Pseudoalteromonas sp. P1-9]MCF6456765.1 thiamine-phosphate kinase [Pseudoalteromonas sp. MMG024]TMO82549.1 thiamine-phosphate kinase [Pseudoalteromonas spongiae]
MQEFELISHFFKGRGVARKDVSLSIGDDAALINVPENCQLAVTTDTLVEGVHFFKDIDPKALGYRALAVNLSDLAAMGAEPAWISVALTLPNAETKWLEQFTQGMHEIAEYYNVQIVGGDTTQGPLTISICAKGFVPNGSALTRSGAKNGDWVFVTGSLGDAGLAIDSKYGKVSLTEQQFANANKAFDYPTPQVAAGQMLRGKATSCIDISDGLIADLGHICQMSGVGAKLFAENIPLAATIKDVLPLESALNYALTYGDEYQLLFTLPEERRTTVEMTLKQYGVALSCIGQINNNVGKVELTLEGKPLTLTQCGFEHFNAE